MLLEQWAKLTGHKSRTLGLQLESCSVQGRVRLNCVGSISLRMIELGQPPKVVMVHKVVESVVFLVSCNSIDASPCSALVINVRQTSGPRPCSGETIATRPSPYDYHHYLLQYVLVNIQPVCPSFPLR